MPEGFWKRGVKENLYPGFNGLDFKPHDAAEMARAIMRLIKYSGVRGQMGQNARHHAENPYLGKSLRTGAGRLLCNVNGIKTRTKSCLGTPYQYGQYYGIGI